MCPENMALIVFFGAPGAGKERLRSQREQQERTAIKGEELT